MKIINETKQTILAENLAVPKNLLDQSLGLLKYKTQAAMLLKTRFGIHTFGMGYPIDVLILDKANRVVASKKDLKPNAIFVWNPNYQTVLELPKGTIEKTQTKINDLIHFIEH